MYATALYCIAVHDIGIGIFTCMCHVTVHVQVQVPVHLLLHVNPQTASVGKTFLTGGALVRLISRVDVLMFLQ